MLNEKRDNIEDSNNLTESVTKSGINRVIFGTSETRNQLSDSLSPDFIIL